MFRQLLMGVAMCAECAGWATAGSGPVSQLRPVEDPQQLERWLQNMIWHHCSLPQLKCSRSWV